MPNSVHFAERAAHYYARGMATTNARNAESLFGLAYLFLRTNTMMNLLLNDWATTRVERERKKTARLLWQLRRLKSLAK